MIESSLKESSITVAIRIRPFTELENTKLALPTKDNQIYGDGALSGNKRFSGAKGKGIRKIVKVVDEKMLIFDPANDDNPIQKMQQSFFPKSTSRIREHRFHFDRLFDQQTLQQQVYNNTTRPLLDSVLDGYNATVFAYGATGCGKTHTISGTNNQPGIIYLTSAELFNRIAVLKQTKKVDVSLSYLEIYNETIRDLLNPETESKLLTIREDSNQRISVRNLSNHKLSGVDEIMELIIKGNYNRTVNSTAANLTSSRSHAVLQINIDQKDKSSNLKEQHYCATLSIIDLAGSERASATKNIGKLLNEGANINRSLLALGNCINALCDPKKRNHIPYRDSKLTRLLKFSLGGNCKTVMIVCISPSSQHYDETLNTLKYANRAKEIKTKITRNSHNLDRHVSSYLKMITEQKLEIDQLKSSQTVQLDTLTANIETIKSTYESQIDRKVNVKIHQRFYLLQKLNVLSFLKSFETNYGAKYDDIPIDLKDIKALIKKIVDKLDIEISHLDQDDNLPIVVEGYNQLTCSYAQLEIEVQINKQFDKSWHLIVANHNNAFNFLSSNFFKVFKKLTFINTSGDIEIIRDENLNLINEMLNDCYEALSQDNFLKLDSKIKEKRVNSPVKSRTNNKKVRWDLPDNNKENIDTNDSPSPMKLQVLNDKFNFDIDSSDIHMEDY